MSVEDIKIAESFRRSTVRAVAGILFFIFVYLLLIVLAIAFLLLCLYGGVAVIALRPSFFTLMIGLGIAAMGSLVVIFLFKFLFHRSKADLSHLTEVTREQEPKLFALIDDLTTKVGTPSPKKVYLSAGVNASVFYDSSFWSMFLPVKKNLEVGMGLVNSVTVNELRAVLAHEFGHFSQRSMKVGSYVYFVNRVIYNMLFENEGYHGIANAVARVNSYLRFFAILAMRIVGGIQWVLHKVYGIVNLNYLKLSREMEFHADEVAARTVGSAPLIDSLLRLDLANNAFESVTGFYQGKTDDAIRATNLFSQQSVVMRLLSEEGRYQVKDGLPLVTLGQASRYNNSKLVFSNQWESHPSHEDRVARLAALAIPETYMDHELARTVFSDPGSTERMLTDKIFAKVSYEKPVTEWDERSFQEAYEEEQDRQRMPEVFNGYYDRHNPARFDLEKALLEVDPVEMKVTELFNDAAIERINSAMGMSSDQHTVNLIGSGKTDLKGFEYDGEKYKVADCAALAERIGTELETRRAEIQFHDRAIYRHLHRRAVTVGKVDELDQAYREYFRVDALVDELHPICDALIEAMAFTNQSTGYDVIESKLEAAKAPEQAFKERLAWMLGQEEFQKLMDAETREDIQRYLDNKNVYFMRPDYLQPVIDLYHKAVMHYRKLLFLMFHAAKMQMLNAQARLLTPGFKE